MKYVHRKSLCFLVTLEEHEARRVKEKIKNGDVIGIDNVVLANSDEFDVLIQQLKSYQISEPGTFKVIESNQIITLDKVLGLS